MCHASEPCAELDSVLFQHPIKSMSYETLKSEILNLIQGRVQGDK